MTFLNRLLGRESDQEPTPGWAEFMGDGFGGFARTVRADLDARNLEYSFEAEEGCINTTGQGREGQKFGLGNLAQLCSQNPRRKWAGLVKQHFDTILNISNQADSALDAYGEDFEAARSLIKVRLYPDDMAGLEFMTTQIPAEGIVAGLVYDLPESVASVHSDHVAKWAIPVDELFEIGLRNVREQDEVKPTKLPGQDGAAVIGLMGESFFTASHALMLDQYLPADLELGAILAIPNRHAVLYHPITDSTAFGALSSIIPAAMGMFEKGPGSVSPHVYWWQTGVIQRQPVETTDQGINFNPTEEFIFQVMNRIRPESA